MIHILCKSLTQLLLLIFFTQQAFAGEISRDIRSGASPETPQGDGGYADLGFGIEANSGPKLKGSGSGEVDLSLNLNIGYQYQGYFVEALSDSQFGLVLGYNALNTQHWTLDVVLGPENNEITGKEYDELTSLRDRHVDLTAGIRATGYFGHSIIQLQLRNEILTNLHNGYSASLTAGRSWQIRNANMHALVSYQHSSSATVDYYFGVRGKEASLEFPQYSASASNIFNSEIGLTYPVNETWILRTKLTASRIDKSISDSPLMQNHKQNLFYSAITLNYVF